MQKQRNTTYATTHAVATAPKLQNIQMGYQRYRYGTTKAMSTSDEITETISLL